MIYLLILSAALSVGLGVLAFGEAMPSRPKKVDERIATIRGTSKESLLKRARQARRERLEALLEEMGDKLPTRGSDRDTVRRRLGQAGFRKPGAVGVYWSSRIVLAAILGGATVILFPLAGMTARVTFFVTAYAAGMGWIVPGILVAGRARARMKSVRRALPDATDLLVVCVEAGLALNQALVRVADEMAHSAPVLAEEFMIVNGQIRAGASRQVALEGIADRTGLKEMRALSTMLIQTDRFGTSVAESLRVHSESLRTERRQQIEEASAKTTIKMVFPLVLCVFPAMFVVILGPGFITILQTLGGLQ
jgi:tight adherence protein C